MTKFTDCGALPPVAMPFMNTVHCEELTLVGGLLALLENRAAPEAISTQLAGWVAHTEAHFARENRLMDEHGFFATAVHQMEHTQALQQLQAVQQQWLAQHDPAALTGYILHWREWLQQHIASMDFVTAMFLSRLNIEVEL